MNRAVAILAAAVAAYCLIVLFGGQKAGPCVGPNCPKPPPILPGPSPRPEPPRPCPGPGPCPPRMYGDKAVIGGRTHDGEELTVDLPGSLHIRNIGSLKDGAGMCVMSSVEMMFRSLGLEDWYGLRDWCAKEDGGAYPGKVDDQLKRFAEWKSKQLGRPVVVPPYIQVEGGTDVIAKTLELLDKTGRGACTTYGYGERYNMQRIAHMVFNPKFRGKYAVCLDNNGVVVNDAAKSENAYEWMDRDEYVKRVCYPSNQGWVFAVLLPAGANLPLHH